MKSSSLNAKLQRDTLLSLFNVAGPTLGFFAAATAESLPTDASALLAHDHHMTVTLEEYHGSPVDVRVLESRRDGDHYSRKIILNRQSDNRTVMFGIVRMDLTVFTAEVRAEIESQQTPLGRVLIANNVLRSVKLLDLYRIEAAGDLAESFEVAAGTVCFGRTAMIYCDGSPAIELLEIVRPTT